MQKMTTDKSWAEEEFRSVDLGDKRLDRRLIRVVRRLADAPQHGIPAAMDGWKETQAAYRLFQNEKVTFEGILEPHAESTLRRVAKESVVFVLQDTTELDFTSKRKKNGDVGPLNFENRVGFYLHPSLVVTREGLHLGTVDARLWSRDPADFGINVDRKKRPFEEKESVRWRDGYRVSRGVAEACPKTTVINVADRESDIYEYLVEATEDPTENSRFVVRAASNRSLTEADETSNDGTHEKLRERMQEQPVLHEVSIDVPKRGNRKARTAVLEIRSGSVELNPPWRRDGRLPKVKVNVVWAREKDAPPGETEPIDWMLLTDLPVSTPEEADSVLACYAARWQIEVFFRVLKTGCEVEELEFRSLSTLGPCLMVQMIVAWRVLNLMMLGRECPDLPCDALLTEAEWKAAWQIHKKERPPKVPPRLGEMMRIIASLGGHLGRKCDGPPGPKPLWIGLRRIADFALAWLAFAPENQQLPPQT
jgi:hypothetical protein